MDSFEWNKIIGAVLGTLLFVVAVKIGSEMIFEVPMPIKPGFVVQGVPTTSASASAQPAEEPLPDFGTVLPKADLAKGQQISHDCQQCHDLSKGGPDKIGPNLWGIVGRPRASRSSYSYSSAMSSSHEPWTFERLFRYLKSPQAVVPGTKMTFAGLPSAQDRIDLIAWLRTQSDSPVPIPPPAPAGASKAPAGGKAAPAATGKTAPAAPANGKTAPAAPAGGAKTPASGGSAPAAPAASGKATAPAPAGQTAPAKPAAPPKKPG